MSNKLNERLRAAIGMMGVESTAGDSEAVNAFRAASRMLKAAGLTWRDVAERSFGQASDGWSPVSPWSAQTPAPPPPPPPSPAPHPASAREKERLSGKDVPVTVIGTIRTLDGESQARKSQMLVLEVETDTAIYGPLMAYAGTLMDNLFKAKGKRAMLRVRPVRDERQIPQVVGCSPM